MPKHLKDLAAFVRQSSAGREGDQYNSMQQPQQQQVKLQQRRQRQQYPQQQPQHHPSHLTAARPRDTQGPQDSSASPGVMTPAASLDDGRTSFAQNPSLLSETESLAELVAREMTASALQRTSNSMSNQQTGAVNNPKGDPSVEPTSAEILADHGKPPAALEARLTTGPLDTLVEQPVTRSAPHHSGNSDNSPFRTDGVNGTMNGGSARVNPAAVPSDVARQTTAQTSGALSETESMAQLIVRSATAKALQLSDSSNSSLSRADSKHIRIGCIARGVAVHEEGEGAKPMDAEAMVSSTRTQGALTQNECFVEHVVRSVMASALQRSTSSLFKIGRGNGPGLVSDGSITELDPNCMGERTWKPAGYSSQTFVEEDAVMQTTVARAIEIKTETARSTAATTSTKAWAQVEAKAVKGAAVTAQSENVASTYFGEFSTDTVRHTNVGEKAVGANDFQAVKIGYKTDSAVGGYGCMNSALRRSDGNEGGGYMAIVGNRNVKLFDSEEDGSNEGHIHEHSSDTFEKEDGADNHCGRRGSLTASSSDGRGNQRRRPPQPGREMISVINTPDSSSGGQATSDFASAESEPCASTPPRTHLLEQSENNHTTNNSPGDARSVQAESGGFDLPGIALRSSVDHSGSTSTRGTGAGRNEPVSIGISSASQGGHATSSRTIVSSIGVPTQGSTGGRSDTRTTPTPSGVVVGFAELNRDLSTRFSGEVMAPSTAAAISALGSKGGEQSPHAFSSTSQHTGDAVDLAGASSLNDVATPMNGGVNVTALEVHTQREPEIGKTTLPRAALSDVQALEKHPARLFHLLWQRNRQAEGVWCLFLRHKGWEPIVTWKGTREEKFVQQPARQAHEHEHQPTPFQPLYSCVRKSSTTSKYLHGPYRVFRTLSN